MNADNKSHHHGITMSEERHEQLMVSEAGAGLEGEIGLTVSGVLEGELDGTAVHARCFTVIRISQPCNSSVQLTGDSGGTLWVSVTLVEELRSSFATVVGKLNLIRVSELQGNRFLPTHSDLVRLGIDTSSK